MQQEPIAREIGPGRLVHLRFSPLWLYVDALREFCSFFARSTFRDDVVGQRVGLVVHELVENAIRYGDDQELELHVEKREDSMTIMVANTTSDAAAEKLQATFAKLQGVDPAEGYLAAVQAAVRQPEGVSGLGFPRIRHEGQVELSLERQQGRVKVFARGKL